MVTVMVIVGLNVEVAPRPGFEPGSYGVDFAPSASFLIIALPSTTSDGWVFRIVLATGHVDVSEHYVDMIVTEQGIADLRGLLPRARAIIENCAPQVQELLAQVLRLRGEEGRTRALLSGTGRQAVE